MYSDVHPIYAQHPQDTIDAQDQHGNKVYIRRLRKDSEELALLIEFSSLKMRSEHWNRVVPIVDSFNDPEDPDIVFIVTDLLHTTTYPAWKYLEDVLEFGEQILGVSLSHRLLSLHKNWLTCTTTGSDVLPFSWDQQCVSILLDIATCIYSVIMLRLVSVNTA